MKYETRKREEMIYLDNAATTVVDQQVWETMLPIYIEEYGNPSALYQFGSACEKKINEVRKIIASILHVDSANIYFSPGGTYANNLVLQGVLSRGGKGNIISAMTEHSSVYQTIQNYQEKKEVRMASVNSTGFIDSAEIASLIDENTLLVSIMHVNNELGTIQPIQEMGKTIKKANPKTLFHVDGIQGFGKVPIDLKRCKVDFYSMSGHKLHGPKGIGAVYIADPNALRKQWFGGNQEQGMFPGTENVAGIIGLGKAAEIAATTREQNWAHTDTLRSQLIRGIQDIEDHKINSPLENYSPFILNLGFKDIRAEVLLHMMDDEGFCISSGSACGKSKRSRVLESIGVPKDYIDGSIRISLSKYNKEEEIDQFIIALKDKVAEIRSIIRRGR